MKFRISTLTFIKNILAQEYGPKIKEYLDERNRKLKEEISIMIKRDGNAHFSDKEVNDYFKQLLKENNISPQGISPKDMKNLLNKFRSFIICKLANRRIDLALNNEITSEIDKVLSKKYTPEQKRAIEEVR